MLRLVLLAALAFPALADADARLRGLDGASALFEAGPGRLLAGERAVFATPGGVYAWPLTGGPARRIADTPDLGSAENDPTEGGGFIRVEAAQPGRIVIVRGEGSVLSPAFGAGRQLAVGPPEGPFADPAGCGEQTGAPAVLDGNRLAYRVKPARQDGCDTKVPDGIAVRDLAGGAVRYVALPRGERRVGRIALRGPYLAYAARHGDRRPERLVVVDWAAGTETLRLGPVLDRAWALDADGTVVSGRAALVQGAGCLFRVLGLRRHPGRTPIAATPCLFGYMSLDGGVLRFAEDRPDRRIAVVDLDVAAGTRRMLAVVSGALFDASATHLVVGDDTCTDGAPRVIALADGPARPAGPRRCPISVRVPRAVRARRRVPLRIGCPRGCRVEVEARTARGDTTYGTGARRQVRRGGAATIRLRVPRFARRRAATMRIVVRVANPAARETILRRRVRLLAGRADGELERGGEDHAPQSS